MDTLYLLGTKHGDFRGPERLRKFFQVIKPTVVGLEATMEGFRKDTEFRRRLSDPKYFARTMNDIKAALPNANIETAQLILKNYAYESVETDKYTASTGAKLVHCDEPYEIVEFENWGTRLVDTFHNVLMASPNELTAETERTYSNPNILTFNMLTLVRIAGRDRFTEAKLREQEGMILYVGGLFHIFGNYHSPFYGKGNLYERLADLKPKRLKLNEADQLQI
ncbi:MAG: hypothetical protein GTN40_03425 [Candidatus Aenigmarchaeota archaeon]|nr:hypothetical protein [Candidatus Aenigmarchaeota archaeon]